MMMQPAEMITVIQASLDGKQIQRRSLGTTDWSDCSRMSWQFDIYEYRVKPEPKELWVVFNETGQPLFTGNKVATQSFASIGNRQVVHFKEVV